MGAKSQDTEAKRPTYTVYMLRCDDGSLYTGITTDMERRLQEHKERGAKAARYTRTHPVVALEMTWTVPDRSTASACEYHIKHLSRDEKLALIQNPSLLDTLIDSKQSPEAATH